MLYFIYAGDKLQWLATETKLSELNEGFRVVSRWDWVTIAQATTVAKDATEKTGRLHISVDRGEYISPRFDVIEVPKIGDEVSYAFNGDSYPDGVITKMSESMRVITTTSGRKFWRQRNSGRWVSDKTWSLVRGHVETRNPHI